MNIAAVADAFVDNPQSLDKTYAASAIRAVPGGDLVPDSISTFYSYSTAMAIKIEEGFLVNPNKYSSYTSTHQQMIVHRLLDAGYYLVGTVWEDRHMVKSHGPRYWRYDMDRDRPWQIWMTETRVKSISRKHLDYNAGWPMPVYFESDALIKVDHSLPDWGLYRPSLDFFPSLAAREGAWYRFGKACKVEHYPMGYEVDYKGPVSRVSIRLHPTLDAKLVSFYVNRGDIDKYLEKIVAGTSMDDNGYFHLDASARRAVKGAETMLNKDYNSLISEYTGEFRLVDADTFLETIDTQDEYGVFTARYPEGMTRLTLDPSRDGADRVAMSIALAIEDDLRDRYIIATNTLKAVANRLK